MSRLGFARDGEADESALARLGSLESLPSIFLSDALSISREGFDASRWAVGDVLWSARGATGGGDGSVRSMYDAFPRVAGCASVAPRASGIVAALCRLGACGLGRISSCVCARARSEFEFSAVRNSRICALCRVRSSRVMPRVSSRRDTGEVSVGAVDVGGLGAGLKSVMMGDDGKGSVWSKVGAGGRKWKHGIASSPNRDPRTSFSPPKWPP